MSNMVAKGQQLYAALGTGDFSTVRQLLAKDFRAELTAGLPNGMGRTYCGLESMIAQVWAPARARSEVAPLPDWFYDVSDTLIVRGFYSGSATRTGNFLHAAFAHFWSFDGKWFTALIQITDSASWRAALNSAQSQ